MSAPLVAAAVVVVPDSDVETPSAAFVPVAVEPAVASDLEAAVPNFASDVVVVELVVTAAVEPVVVEPVVEVVTPSAAAVVAADSSWQPLTFAAVSYYSAADSDYSAAAEYFGSAAEEAGQDSSGSPESSRVNHHPTWSINPCSCRDY